MDGIMYLLNQAGIALAQANAELESLRARLSETATKQEPSP